MKMLDLREASTAAENKKYRKACMMKYINMFYAENEGSLRFIVARKALFIKHIFV